MHGQPHIRFACTSFPRTETNEGKKELQSNLVNTGNVKSKCKDSGGEWRVIVFDIRLKLLLK